MESEFLSENLKWEARRVAAAFGVKGEPEISVGGTFIHMSAHFGPDNKYLEWKFLRPMGNILVTEWFYVKVAPMSDDKVDDWSDMDNCVSYCQIVFSRSRDAWRVETFGKLRNELSHSLANGLYRLGFKQGILDKLDYSLTAHEKLELRLSMPREFWPKMWICEAGTSPTV